MSTRESTPPTTAAAATSSPMTPNQKRAKMGSPERAGKTPLKEGESTERAQPRKSQSDDNAATEAAQSSENAGATGTTQAQPLAAEGEDDDGDLEADDGYADSAFGTDKSDTTSVSSSIYEGYIEHGRRYQTKREGEYWGPSDEKQFESMQKCHMVHYILDSQRSNPFFYSPVPETIQNILDIGTGTGDWCRDVADLFPSALVQGVDLSPVPNVWVPPNCKFEVDDILKTWQFKECGSFGLVHLRWMLGAFTDEQWRLVYKQSYNNLAPGGWIEQIETGITIRCDDGTLPADSVLAGWGDMFLRICEKSGKKIDTEETLRSKIEAAGFTNIHEKVYKVPIGEWTKNPLLKEAGKYEKMQILEGLEGYAMFLLTHFGEPTPWSPEEVQVLLAKARNEINNPAYHTYARFRRVWAQKPYDTKPAAKKPEAVVENVA